MKRPREPCKPLVAGHLDHDQLRLIVAICNAAGVLSVAARNHRSSGASSVQQRHYNSRDGAANPSSAFTAWDTAYLLTMFSWSHNSHCLQAKATPGF
jgi:hypothetical protein